MRTLILSVLPCLMLSAPVLARDYIQCGQIATVSPECNYQCDDQAYVSATFEPGILRKAGDQVTIMVGHDEIREYYDGQLERSDQLYSVLFPAPSSSVDSPRWAVSFQYDSAAREGVLIVRVYDREATAWTGRLQKLALPCKPVSF
jgi:hypothetical protein